MASEGDRLSDDLLNQSAADREVERYDSFLPATRSSPDLLVCGSHPEFRIGILEMHCEDGWNLVTFFSPGAVSFSKVSPPCFGRLRARVISTVIIIRQSFPVFFIFYLK